MGRGRKRGGSDESARQGASLFFVSVGDSNAQLPGTVFFPMRFSDVTLSTAVLLILHVRTCT